MTVYHVFANRSNIGDWLSAIGIQKLLAPIQVVELLCDEPFIDDTIQVLTGATEDDFVVIGGGGLFMDYFEPFWRRFELLATEGLRFAIWGVGFCDLKMEATLPDISLLQRIVSLSEVTVLRDSLSNNLLGLPDLPPPCPCPSLITIEAPTEPAFGLLMVDNYTTAGEAAYNRMLEVGQAFADQTGRPFRQTNNRIEPGRFDHMASELEKYRRSDVVLSSALHGCVIGVGMRKHVLAVSGDWKIEGFMEQVGRADQVTEVADLSDLHARLMNAASTDTAFSLNRIYDRLSQVATKITSRINAQSSSQVS